MSEAASVQVASQFWSNLHLLIFFTTWLHPAIQSQPRNDPTANASLLLHQALRSNLLSPVTQMTSRLEEP